MQRINETIINPIFLVLFFGTPLLCWPFAGNSVIGLNEPGRLWLFIGSLAYLVGPLGLPCFSTSP